MYVYILCVCVAGKSHGKPRCAGVRGTCNDARAKTSSIIAPSMYGNARSLSQSSAHDQVDAECVSVRLFTSDLGAHVGGAEAGHT